VGQKWKIGTSLREQRSEVRVKGAYFRLGQNFGDYELSYYFPFSSLSVNLPHFRRTYRCSAPDTTPPGTSFHLCHWEGTTEFEVSVGRESRDQRHSRDMGMEQESGHRRDYKGYSTQMNRETGG
jgi:hypothetical protein